TGTNLLVLVITHHGQVLTRMIERPEGAPQDAVDAIARRLTDHVTDKTLRQAIALTKQMARDVSPAEGGLLAIVGDSIRDMEEHDDTERVLIGGVSNLAGELALWRVETMRRLFDALEHEADVLRLLRDAAANAEPSVTIGGEHPSTGEWEASVVAAPYRAGDM